MYASPLQQDEQLKDGVLKQVKLSWKNNNNTNSIKIKLPSHHHQDDLHIHSTMPTLPAFLG